MSHGDQILLVDDDRDILNGISLRLRAAGYTTLFANNGDQAIAEAIESHPDAILLDVRMPGKDGLAALAELQGGDATRDIPIVMLSASLVDEMACLDAGARFFLTKPYRADTLLAAIETALAEVNT